jgi:hypothetical protein
MLFREYFKGRLATLASAVNKTPANMAQKDIRLQEPGHAMKLAVSSPHDNTNQTKMQDKWRRLLCISPEESPVDPRFP